MGTPLGKPTFIVDEDGAGRVIGSPSPHYEVVVVRPGPDGEASHPHARIASRNQAVSQNL